MDAAEELTGKCCTSRSSSVIRTATRSPPGLCGLTLLTAPLWQRGRLEPVFHSQAGNEPEIDEVSRQKRGVMS